MSRIKTLGFLERMTGALHLRSTPDRKAVQLPPEVEKILSVDHPAEPHQAVQQENNRGPDVMSTPGETETTVSGEKSQSLSQDGSIFDLLAQVQRGGLGSEPSSDETGTTQLPGSESEITSPIPLKGETLAESESSDSLPQDNVITTSSLASRLWGLQELPTDLDKFPQSEPETAPFSDETAQTVTQESEEKRSLFDRLKGQRSDEKDTKPLQIDDDEMINRIARTTGILHEPPDSLMPGRPAKGSHTPDEVQPDSQDNKESAEAG